MNIIEILRTPKLFDIAMFDVIGTYLVAYTIWLIIYKYNPHLKNGWIWSFLIFIILVILGIIVHVGVNRKTKLNFYMGLSEDPRPVKIE